MKLNTNMAWLICMMLMLVFQLSQATDADPENNLSSVTKRSTIPAELCNSNNEGDSIYNQVDSTVWLCESSVWKPYRIVPSTGKTEEVSAYNCKVIKETLSTDCGISPENGVYWVQDQQIYCDMSIDGGGWTLVWQHTYMKFNPLLSDMFYFSDHYRPCVKDASDEDWCNIPNKTRFNPTEMMIVAYHIGTIVYAYKGDFNGSIDYDWTGAILHNPTKLNDECVVSSNNGVQPAPSINQSGIFGLTFDKHSPDDYYRNCDTYEKDSTLTNPIDCRWHDCGLPSNISLQPTDTNMTMAIFVR